MGQKALENAFRKAMHDLITLRAALSEHPDAEQVIARWQAWLRDPEKQEITGKTVESQVESLRYASDSNEPDFEDIFPDPSQRLLDRNAAERERQLGRLQETT